MKKHVVCIDGGEWHPMEGGDESPLYFPEKGEIYTIVGVCEDPGFKAGFGYHLKELNPIDSWDASSFREIDESFGPWVEATLMRDFEYETVNENKMTMRDIIAWLRNKEKVGTIHTIGKECYWDNETRGIVKSFGKIRVKDLVIDPKTSQQCARIYSVFSTQKKETEDSQMPLASYVKLFHVISLTELEAWKEKIADYPYL